MVFIKKPVLLRTVDGCLDFIKKYDPETVVSTFYIRELIRKNIIKIKPSGTKAYVNLIDLLEYLGFEIEFQALPTVEETLQQLDNEKRLNGENNGN